MDFSPYNEWLLKTTLQGGLLVCLIMLIKLIVRNRLGTQWHCWLWLILLVRLSLPWAPQSRLSVYRLFGPSLWARPTRTFADGAAPTTTATDPNTEGLRSAQSPRKTRTEPNKVRTPQTARPDATQQPAIHRARTGASSIHVRSVLPWVWLVGAAVLALIILTKNLRLWLAVKRERPVTDQEILDLLEDCKMHMGVQTIVGVVVTDKVRTPALFGFLRPRLLLPQGLLEVLSLEELHYVFLHELAHLRRADIYIGWWTALLQTLHWFNPLIWLAFRRMRADQEMACDALAMSRMAPEDPPKYGRTIVRLLERFARPQYVPSVAGILEDGAQLERRMTMIAKFKNRSRRWPSLGVILVVILACVSLPDAIRTGASASPAASLPKTAVRQVWAGAADPYFMGAPSPNGKYLSYVDWRTGDLAVHELATAQSRRLTNEGWDKGWAQHSVFSPDGSRLAYYWWNSEKGDQAGPELRIIGLDGPEPRVVDLNKGMSLRVPAGWSPDGKHILGLASAEDRSLQIVLIGIGDGQMRVLKTLPRHPWLWRYPSIRRKVGMSLSPDGRYLAYTYPTEPDSPKCDIFLLAVDGSGETALVEHPADDFVLGWAPDGEGVVFASDRTGSIGIWGVEVANGKPQGTPHLLRAEVGLFHPLGLTSNGSYYYGVLAGGSNVYVAAYDSQRGNVTGDPVLMVKHHEGSNWAPDWSPDGRYLACVSVRGPGQGSVFIIQ